MSTVIEFRTQVENLVYNVMDCFDKSGKNSDYWKSVFKAIPDKDFLNFIEAFVNDPDKFFTVEIKPFDKSQSPDLTSYHKAAKILGIELEEYVRLPYLIENTSIQEHPKSLTAIPVGKLHMKRLQQIKSKKNKITTSIEDRDLRKGQVKGNDKGAQMSDADVLALSTLNMNNVLKEMLGPRADDAISKEVMIDRIRKYGHVSLSDLPDDVENKQAINTLNTYFLSAGLITDLVSDSYLLPITKKMLKNQIPSI